jgi:hypothetical protein
MLRPITLAALLATATAGLPSVQAQEVPEVAGAAERVEEPGERPRHHDWLRQLLDSVEVVDTPVYRRNSLELKYEWTQKPAGAALGQFMFKPTFAWGENREFAVRVEAPVET